MTVPVANPNKVKQRRQAQDSVEEFEQSYVFDYQEDKRARAADLESPTDSRLVSSRQKKRHLEQRFGSSAPTFPSPNTKHNRKKSIGHHSVPVFRDGSDNSLDFDADHSILVPSKANQQSLNGYIQRTPRTKSSSRGSRGTTDSKRKVQMRDTDRLIRPRGIERQGSGLGPKRHNSLGSQSQTQRSVSSHNSSQRGRSPSNKRGHSGGDRTAGQHHRSRSATKSCDRRPPVTRQGSRTMVEPRSRSLSMDRRPSQTRTLSKQGSVCSDRRNGLQKGKSNTSMGSQRSIMTGLSLPTVVTQGDKTIVFVPVTQEQAKSISKTPKGAIPYMFKGYLGRKIPPIEETPPKSLVLIWVLVCAELAFDLATTVIAFLSLVENDTCCGERIELGPIPMTVTIPFFMLVVTELALLFRAMMMTLWPSIFTGDVTDDDLALRASRTSFMQCVCCCLRWKAKIVLQILNFLVVINPFFGCIIAWMLLYQSDKVESFVVLGLEGVSILLHFCTVYLEGSCKTWTQFFCHCIPILPFFASVTLVLFYLKQGGVCYLVDKEVFMFTGCEICPDGLPPIDNMCQFNGTNYTVSSNGIIDFDFENVEALSDVKGTLTKRVEQGEYCGNQRDDGPDMSFCFFSYN